MGAQHRAQAAVGRLRAVLADAAACDGLVLTSPGTVAWATGGTPLVIDRTAGSAPAWLVVPAAEQRPITLVTTVVEAPRLRAESVATSLGWDVADAPWDDPTLLVHAAERAVGAPAARIGSDAHPAFGRDLSIALTAQRIALTADERSDLRQLARDATLAVQESLRQWRPGQTDRQIAARIAATIESVGATAPVLLVGGDDRVLRYRHPVAIGAPVQNLAMAVLVAERGGLHVALTRYAATTDGAAELRPRLDAVRRIHDRLLKTCTPGTEVGVALSALAKAYADAGAAEAWYEHYQGGPIGFAQREFEISPRQSDSPWWRFAIPSGSAVAWNPSLQGGAKDEDTFIISDDGPDWITRVAPWPTLTVNSRERPDILPVESREV